MLHDLRTARIDVRTPAPATDAALLLAVQRRLPGADRALWDRFVPLVRGLLGRALGPDEDVADTVQNVFLRLFDRVGTIRDPEAFRSFVVSVTMNELRVLLRKRRVRRIIGLTRTGSVPDGEGAPTGAPARIALRRFYALLDRLSSEDRTCFVLRQIEELELTEIATVLGLSVATIKRRVARVTERLMTRVRQDPFLIDYLVHAPKGPNHA